jgi:hypothetical protein
MSTDQRFLRSLDFFPYVGRHRGMQAVRIPRASITSGPADDPKPRHCPSLVPAKRCSKTCQILWIDANQSALWVFYVGDQ